MQRVFVDFSRVLADDRLEVGFADDPELSCLTLQIGERVILYETGLEVEGILQQETRFDKLYWYAKPDWMTRKDTEIPPLLQQAS